MVETIRINKIVNGYTSTSGWLDDSKCTVYHKDLDSCFQHLTAIFNNKTNLEYTGEIKYTKKD